MVVCMCESCRQTQGSKEFIIVSMLIDHDS